ncbi:MAG: hypothetical protein K9L32_00375 [Chromatiaceae bacterium]|nr:hypothetical protein [Chromatiaceae bacterium]MCF8002660.1 hypothetical protein [Chromatiaceae bacterium]
MKQCSHCGDWFAPKFANAKLCWPCWQKRETAFNAYDDLQSELRLLRTENNDLWRQLTAAVTQPQPKGIPPELIPKLIRLCHPDRHDGSAIANEVTTWLLQQRRAA